MRSEPGQTERRHILRARLVWLGNGLSLRPGAIEWAGGRIVGLRPCGPRGVQPIAVMPGLVNAHCHLQLGALPKPVRTFLPWIDAVLKARAVEDRALWTRRTEQTIDQFLDEGTLAVGEIDSSGVSADVLRTRKMAGRCYQEVLGFDLDAAGARALLAQRSKAGTRRCPSGFSPHAPYSTSDALFQAARDSGLPTTIHVAETREELEFVATLKGPFRALLEALGKWRIGRSPADSPVALLARLQVLSSRSLLVHGQHLLPSDLTLLRDLHVPIVVCPGAIQYFRRTPPPVPEWLAMGLTVALGTDSLAGNDRLSMRAELRRASGLWPNLDPEVLLRMATHSGGMALSRKSLGRIRVGGPADFLVVALGEQAQRNDSTLLAQFTEGFVDGQLPVAEVHLAGQRHRSHWPGRG